MARGNRKQDIFLDDGDLVRYLKLMGEGLEERSFAIYAYCLMPNHVHLLIEQVSDYPLSRYMHRLQAAYALFFNAKHHNVGHLFQGRYKAILVDKDAYLQELVRYIHLNPHWAMNVGPDSYPWSSHRQYLGKDQHPLVRVESSGVLRLFSRLKAVARKRYQEYLRIGMKQDRSVVIRGCRGGCILGDESFEEECRQRSGERASEAVLEMKMGLGDLWKNLLRREGFSTEPTGWTRSRLVGEVAYLMGRTGAVKQREVAEYFCMKPAAVNKAVKRLRMRWEMGSASREVLMNWARDL